jgi:hypothetical protein
MIMNLYAKDKYRESKMHIYNSIAHSPTLEIFIWLFYDIILQQVLPTKFAFNIDFARFSFISYLLDIHCTLYWPVTWNRRYEIA